MYKENFKKVIIDRRQALKLTKKDLAAHLKISYPTYLWFEKTGAISAGDYFKLCVCLGIEVLMYPKDSIAQVE